MYEFNRLSIVFQPDPTPDVRKKPWNFYKLLSIHLPPLRLEYDEVTEVENFNFKITYADTRDIKSLFTKTWYKLIKARQIFIPKN